MSSIVFLIFAPFILSIFIPLMSLKIRNFVVITSVISLATVAVNTTFSSAVSFNIPHYIHEVLVALDIFLLLYFLHRGRVQNSTLVSILAIVQLVLYAIVLNLSSAQDGLDIVVDGLSIMMYLIINIVGGLIIIYALEYIEHEDISAKKKNIFIAMLLFFIGVMNALVSANSIELFFLLFELTTLCSYILIGFRADEVATQNSIKALWMNQIGGVAILLALIFSITSYETIYFSELISKVDNTFLIPITLLIVAALVKGASLPFQSWLLGAMVAPTPVSAILHSATMVKIAPFLILKLSPAFTPFVSITLSLFGAFVFLVASVMALNKDFFKEVLGLSTIALLALMISLAAYGTPEATTAAMILLCFHAVSKALLFLQAGILEKNYHLKYISDIDSLINIAPKTLFFIMVGFASLTLPPFGAFVAKFLAITAISDQILNNPLNAIVLALLVLGSVVLAILYFKVTSKLFTKEVFQNFSKEKLAWKYFIPSFALFLLLVAGVLFMIDLKTIKVYELVVPTLLLVATPLLFKYATFKNTPRSKEYNCGEKDEFIVSTHYYEIAPKYLKLFSYIAIAFIVVLQVGGLF
ncbi:MAG: pesticidal protein Cry5Ba [Helicobacteraceae bacterium]|nr:pesticidal protein Cry5Ba [Helicobacteraceae bacterium]